VAPCIVPHVVGKLLVRLHRLARQFLLLDQSAAKQLLRHATNKAQSGHHGFQVIARDVAAFLEIVKGHQRRIAWIGRTQHDLAGPIVGVALKHRPGEVVVMFGNDARIAG
jgi:hypothetical protein